MATAIQAIRGMNDIIPGQIEHWHQIEAAFRDVIHHYGYQEIRLPILEKTELFKRSIGEVTDIVEKEMYTFIDRNGDSLTLRPEGTAVCVRAGIEHGLLYNQIQRFWYAGAMFRHERPQKGRYRQFYHLGAETYGMAGPEIDAELIFVLARLWRRLGLTEKLRLQINSLGSNAARKEYREKLVAYLSDHHQLLDEDSLRRLQTNPLRILDSKNPAMAEMIAAAPRLLDYLDTESKAHFDKLCGLLSHAGIKYEINPRLVRGLDYYNCTVFEWVTDHLGAQGTVCAGGRYDGLVEQLGGKATPAVGFAMGLERLVLLLADDEKVQPCTDIYLVILGEAATQVGLSLAEQLRDCLPGIKLVVDCTGGQLKNQLRRADQNNAALVLILGQTELENNTITLNYKQGEQRQSASFSLKDIQALCDELKRNMRPGV